MDTEKKSGEQRTDQPKPDIGDSRRLGRERRIKRVNKAARPRSGLQGTAQKGARIRFFA